MATSLAALILLLSSLTGTLLLLQKQHPLAIEEVQQSSAGSVGDTSLILEYAQTERQKRQGLSGRPGLSQGHGMLFVYREPGDYGIWMKDMRFPLDILWFDANKRLVDLHERATPDSYPQVFHSAIPAQYILEVPAGFVHAHDLALGDVIVFPDAIE